MVFELSPEPGAIHSAKGGSFQYELDGDKSNERGARTGCEIPRPHFATRGLQHVPPMKEHGTRNLQGRNDAVESYARRHSDLRRLGTPNQLGNTGLSGPLSPALSPSEGEREKTHAGVESALIQRQCIPALSPSLREDATARQAGRGRIAGCLTANRRFRIFWRDFLRRMLILTVSRRGRDNHMRALWIWRGFAKDCNRGAGLVIGAASMK